jgi:hypothetical protein
LDDVRAEVAALRADVDRLRDDAAGTRVMAAMADRDASEVRTAIRGIVAAQNALRETQLEQGQALAQQGQSLRNIAEATAVLLAGQHHHEEILSSLVTTVTRYDEQFAEILDRLPAKNV